MTRPLRIEYPGAFYHVINRGRALGNYFGQISGARIAAVLKKVKTESDADRHYKEKIHRIEKRIVNN